VKTANWIELAQDRVLMPPVVNLEILLGYNSRLIVNKEEPALKFSSSQL
jgi:hypothetical protein